MAKKAKTVYICQECGYESPRWMGQCICGAWNSFVEEKVLPDTGDDTRQRFKAGSRSPSVLKSVGTLNYERLNTGIGELNRVLGGGMVKGSLILISGEPGIGKSTLIIQTAENVAKGGHTVLYVSGEESEEQIKLRADRVCGNLSDKLFVLAETNIENVETACENLKPDLLIVDSIQTMYSDQLDSAPGSISQVRQIGNVLMRLGKSSDMPVFIVAHVTKSGDLAGPKTVEHLVDCVLNFTGERDQEIRVLRAYKNRFGTTSEIGAFTMEEKGLREVPDISATFLENSAAQTEGSVTTSIYEGSRPVMFEIQALVTPASGVGFSRRTAVGIDNTRLSMIIAVMEKKLGMPLGNEDIYLNVVGGIRPDGTGTDLAVALAIYSSFRRIAPVERTLALGEVGLTGDLRPVRNAERIVKEAARLGFTRIIMPRSNAERIKDKVGNCRIFGVRNISEAIRAFQKEDNG